MFMFNTRRTEALSLPQLVWYLANIRMTEKLLSFGYGLSQIAPSKRFRKG